MRRVVITGLGVICAAGEDKDTFYNNLINGKPCIERVENFDVSLFVSKVASQDLDFDPAAKAFPEGSGSDARSQVGAPDPAQAAFQEERFCLQQTPVALFQII